MQKDHAVRDFGSPLITAPYKYKFKSHNIRLRLKLIIV